MDKGDHLECGSSIPEMAEKHQYDLKLYRSVIRDIIEKINDVKFLRRIYISLRDYQREKPE